MEPSPDVPTLPTLPAPPPAPFSVAPAAPVGTAAPTTPRPGQLTPQWGTIFWVGWLLVVGGLVTVWYSSRTIGLSTWWLGPRAQPRLLLVNLLPFTAPIALCVAGLTGIRRLPWWGIAGATFLAGVAAFDIPRVPGYAVIEFVLAGAGLCVSVASFAGMYRSAPQAVTDDEAPTPVAADAGAGA